MNTQQAANRPASPDRLVRNSAFLMLSTVVTAGLGFVFWVVVARLFSEAEIGIATTLVSATALISYLSLFGLNSVLIRFPASTVRNAEVTQSIIVVTTAALGIAVAYLLIMRAFVPELAFIQHNATLFAAFVAFCVFASINIITDSVFIAKRMPHYNVLIDGLLQGGAKVAACFAVTAFGAAGILSSVGIGYAVAAVASIFFMYRVCDFRFTVRPLRTPLLGRVGFSSASYVSSILNLAPVLLLPQITLHKLGAEATAFYYMAFQIANLLNAASHAVGESLMAEAATDESRLASLLKRSAVVLTAFLIPGVLAVAGASELLLRVFGDSYAAEARTLLVLLSVSAFAVGLNTWASFGLKLVRQMGHLVASNVVFLVVTVGCAWVWASHGVLGIGWAWLAGNLFSGAYAAIVLFVAKTNRSSRPLLPSPE